jgi:hypothetical protein
MGWTYAPIYPIPTRRHAIDRLPCSVPTQHIYEGWRVAPSGSGKEYFCNRGCVGRSSIQRLVRPSLSIDFIPVIPTDILDSRGSPCHSLRDVKGLHVLSLGAWPLPGSRR